LDTRAGAGYGASVSWEWALKKKHAIRVGLEYTAFKDKIFYDHPHDPGVLPREMEGSATNTFGMLDYIYSFVSYDYGLYLSLGAGYGDFKVKPDEDKVNGPDACFSAGVGYTITKHFRLEAKAFISASYNPSGPGSTLYNWQQASLIYRF
jgi:hypothetical protein